MARCELQELKLGRRASLDRLLSEVRMEAGCFALVCCVTSGKISNASVRRGMSGSAGVADPL